MASQTLVICLAKKCPDWSEGGICGRDKININVRYRCEERTGLLVIHHTDIIVPFKYTGKLIEMNCMGDCRHRKDHCGLKQITLSEYGICQH